MLKFGRIIFCLVILVVLANAGRYEEDYDENLEKEHMLDLLDRVKLMLRSATDRQWTKMKVRSESLLNFVIELNNLRSATIDLTSLLLNSDECTKVLDKFKTAKGDMKEVNNILFNVTFVPDENLKGGLDHVQKVVLGIESLNAKAMETFLSVMSSLERSYDDMLSNILEEVDLKKKSTMSEVSLDEYLQNFNRTIKQIDDKVDATIIKTEDEIRESKHTNEQSGADISNVMQDLAYSSKFQCSVVRINEGYEALECLNDNDMSDLFGALSKMKQEITDYYEINKNSLTPEVVKTLTSLTNSIKQIIEKIKKFFEMQKKYEDQMFLQMKEGIKKGNIDALNETAFKIIRDYKQAEEFVIDFWKSSNKDYNKTLEKAKSFIYFPTAIRAVQRVELCALLDDMGGNLPRLMQNLHEYTGERLKLAFNGKTYHKNVYRYVYDIFTLQDYYASNFLYNMLNKFEKKQFMAGREAFLQDVKLFLELNLQLVLRSNCNPSLILLLGRPSEIKRYILKAISYIELVEMAYAKSTLVKRRMGLLKEFLWYYRANPLWIKSLPSCRAMADLKKYKYKAEK